MFLSFDLAAVDLLTTFAMTLNDFKIKNSGLLVILRFQTATHI